MQNINLLIKEVINCSRLQDFAPLKKAQTVDH